MALIKEFANGIYIDIHSGKSYMSQISYANLSGLTPQAISFRINAISNLEGYKEIADLTGTSLAAYDVKGYKEVQT